MIIIWKNKGILIPVYVFSTFLVLAILNGVLKRNIGGIFAIDYDFRVFLGLVFFISGIWTFLTSEEYIKDNGKKIVIDSDNTFFLISMKIWGYVMVGFGILFLLYGIYLTLTA